MTRGKVNIMKKEMMTGGSTRGITEIWKGGNVQLPSKVSVSLLMGQSSTWNLRKWLQVPGNAESNTHDCKVFVFQNILLHNLHEIYSQYSHSSYNHGREYFCIFHPIYCLHVLVHGNNCCIFLKHECFYKTSLISSYLADDKHITDLNETYTWHKLCLKLSSRKTDEYTEL